MPKSKRKRGRSKSKSGYFGAYKTLSGKYQASIRANGKLIYIGSSYETAEHAAKAYDKEAIKLRKPLSQLNFPKKAPLGYTPIQINSKFHPSYVGYRGVSKVGKKFRARIQIGDTRLYIGTYGTTKEAGIAYDRAVLKANEPKSLLNFPDTFIIYTFRFNVQIMYHVRKV